MYAAALGIEIPCITAAEIGENAGLYILGFNHVGVPFVYAMGYLLATFITFVTILSRYKYTSGDRIDSCSSVLEQDANKGFLSYNVQKLWIRFEENDGIAKAAKPEILKASLIILVIAETACIIMAETVDLIFYKQAIYLVHSTGFIR